MQIRVERADDLIAIADVHRRAFGADGEKVAGLVNALRSATGPDDRFSLIAEEASQVVGHVMFTHSWLDAPRRLVKVQVLSPLAVLPEYQRRGIGFALASRGVELARGLRVPLVFLEGDPRYYARFGFAAGGQKGFHKPSIRIPDAAFQVLCLPDYEPWMTGTLVYSETFWQHDAVGLRGPGVA